eukprot:3863048-Amphidinium_carterae.1
MHAQTKYKTWLDMRDYIAKCKRLEIISSRIRVPAGIACGWLGVCIQNKTVVHPTTAYVLQGCLNLCKYSTNKVEALFCCMGMNLAQIGMIAEHTNNFWASIVARFWD